MNKCPHCRKAYTLGVDGTVDGCDECTGTVRNPLDHTIVDMDFSKVFEEEDSLTDMEKA